MHWQICHSQYPKIKFSLCRGSRKISWPAVNWFSQVCLNVRCYCCVIIVNYCINPFEAAQFASSYLYISARAFPLSVLWIKRRYRQTTVTKLTQNYWFRVWEIIIIRKWNSSWSKVWVLTESENFFLRATLFIYGWINNFTISQGLPVIFTISVKLWQLAITRKSVSFDFKRRRRICTLVLFSRVVWIHSCRCVIFLPLVIIGNYFTYDFVYVGNRITEREFPV